MSSQTLVFQGTVAVDSDVNGLPRVTVTIPSGTIAPLEPLYSDPTAAPNDTIGTLIVEGPGTLSLSSNVKLNDLKVYPGGTFLLQNATLTTYPIAVSAGGEISGTGALTGNNINAPIIDDGSIIASGGSLAVSATVTGYGTLGIADQATFSIGGSIGSGLNIVFESGGSNESLVLGDPSAFGGLVEGFSAGDSISFAGTYTDLSSSFSGSTLTVDGDGTPIAQFDFTNGYNSGNTTASEYDGVVTVQTSVLPCFAEGTRIATPRGEMDVQQLVAGDLVCLANGGSRPVRWIGRRSLVPADHPKPESVLPVRICRHALGWMLPRRDLLLSPDHAVFLADVLVPVKLLINGTTIRQIRRRGRITYFHVELDSHDVLLAEGLPVESYLETGNRGAFETSNMPIVLHPDFGWRVWEAEGCAPLVVAGPKLAAARQIVARAAASLAEGNRGTRVAQRRR